MLLYLLDCCLLSSVVVSTVHRPPADSDFFRSLIISDTVGQPSPPIAGNIIVYKQHFSLRKQRKYLLPFVTQSVSKSHILCPMVGFNSSANENKLKLYTCTV